MFKKIKISNSRLLFLLIGILLAISVSGVWAAWNSTVSGGQTLTSVLWNDVVAKLADLDTRLGNVGSVNFSRTTSQPVLFQRFVGPTGSPYYNVAAPTTNDENVWSSINLSTFSPPANTKYAAVKFFMSSTNSRNAWIFWRKPGDPAPATPVVNTYSANNSDDAAGDTNTVWIPYDASSPQMEVMWATSNGNDPNLIRVVLEGWIVNVGGGGGAMINYGDCVTVSHTENGACGSGNAWGTCPNNYVMVGVTTGLRFPGACTEAQVRCCRLQ
jgi:hypothetical protein